MKSIECVRCTNELRQYVATVLETDPTAYAQRETAGVGFWFSEDKRRHLHDLQSSIVSESLLAAFQSVEGEFRQEFERQIAKRIDNVRRDAATEFAEIMAA